jgi:fructokinase
MTQKRILAFGEILWDLLPDATLLGGAPFNFSYRIHSLGHEALFASRLGRDDLGVRACNQVETLGLSTQLLQWDNDHPTGTVVVSFDEHKNPDYVIIPHVAYDFTTLTVDLQQAAASADAICFGTLAQRSEVAGRTLTAILQAAADSCFVFYDINLRKKCYTLDHITRSLASADALKLNEDEAVQLAALLEIPCHSIAEFGDAILRLWPLTYCVVTLGENGVFAADRHGRHIYEPGYHIPLADSLGSGDAFSAGFVHNILAGASLAEACRFGNMLGALVATKQGATALVSQQELEAFKQTTCPRKIHTGFQSG